MPILTTCHNCGFEGPHGFSDSAGPLLTSYCHVNDSGPDCVFYKVHPRGGKLRAFKTRKAAWKYARGFLSHENPVWLAAWEAEMAGHSKKARELFKKWNDETQRANARVYGKER